MAPCRSAVGNREIMDEVRMYVIRRPHGVIPEFLAPMPKMTEEGNTASRHSIVECRLRILRVCAPGGCPNYNGMVRRGITRIGRAYAVQRTELCHPTALPSTL